MPSRKRKGSLASLLLLFNAKLRLCVDCSWAGSVGFLGWGSVGLSEAGIHSSQQTAHRLPSRKRKGSPASLLLLFNAKLRLCVDCSWAGSVGFLGWGSVGLSEAGIHSSQQTAHRLPSRKRKGSPASLLLLFNAKLRLCVDCSWAGSVGFLGWGSVGLSEAVIHSSQQTAHRLPSRKRESSLAPSLLLFPTKLRFAGSCSGGVPRFFLGLEFARYSKLRTVQLRTSAKAHSLRRFSRACLRGNFPGNALHGVARAGFCRRCSGKIS